MKNILKISAFMILMILGSASEIVAQKFGHLNSQELILLLPEAGKADETLVTYQKGLADTFEKKVQKFQADVKAFETEAGGGTLNQLQIEEKSAGLQKRQKGLQEEEYSLGEQVNEKRAELLKPILEKIDVAIKAVGKENGYTMIFDSSGMNVMLYNKDADDVMSLVKVKLGL